MAHTCPICKADATRLDPTGDATGYGCPFHGNFKVANAIFGIPALVSASRDRWEKALSHANRRATGGEWPVVQSYDF